VSNTVDIELHPKQTLALTSKATEILYGGAAGGGKSHLMRAAAFLWCAEIPGLQVYLFRRLSDDLNKNHMEGSGSFPEMLAPLFASGQIAHNGSKNVLRFWNGSNIWLCHCQHEKDRFKYQGAEIHVLMIDELTHFTEVIYRFLRGRCRLGGLRIPPKYAGQFPRIVNGSNPGGVGHTFVRRMFINNAPPLAIVDQKKGEGGLRRQYIPARLQDNPTLTLNDPDYISRLEGLGSPELVKAMRDGNWDIVAGGALDDVWDLDVVRVPRFVVPSGWRLDRAHDWGSAKPFSVGWWAVADGTEATLPNGSRFCPQAGSLVRCHEWYGSKEVGSNEGLKLSALDVAAGIKEREAALTLSGWIKRRVNPGPADNSIWTKDNEDSDSIGKIMENAGVKWTESNKSPGSRIVGLQLLRDRLKAATTREGAAIYFMDHCTAALATLPVLPRDPNNIEDVDSAAEDHIYDEVRYRCLHDPRKFVTSLNVKHQT
jgi:hypothetical protein